MLLAVRARGNIVTKAIFKIFIKELGDMGSNILEFVDETTWLRVSIRRSWR
jgi:hypothetical protein